MAHKADLTYFYIIGTFEGLNLVEKPVVQTFLTKTMSAWNHSRLSKGAEFSETFITHFTVYLHVQLMSVQWLSIFFKQWDDFNQRVSPQLEFSLFIIPITNTKSMNLSLFSQFFKKKHTYLNLLIKSITHALIKIKLTNSTMSQNSPQNQQYLDAKDIPKFQFQLIDQQLIKCIKELYFQAKNQQKTISLHKKQLQQKLTILTLIDSLQQIATNLTFPTQLESLLPLSAKNKNYNDPSNPVLTQTMQLSNKFTHFSQILSILNSKINSLDKRITQSQEKNNLNLKEKVSSLEEQLTVFVKDYRLNFKDLTKKFEETKTSFQNKAKQVEVNTLWKITECTKRLEDRPNVDMVKNSLSEMEFKLTKMIQTGANGSIGSGYEDTAKMEQDIIKLKKLLDFNTIQTQSQIKTLSNKMQNNYLSLKSHTDEKLEMTKRIQNLNVSHKDAIRKLNSLETKLNETAESGNKLSLMLDSHNQHILKLNQTVQKFTKNDQFAKLLQKIDPHEICLLSNSVKFIQEKQIQTDNRITTLTSFIEALRSKVEFWNVSNGQSTQKSEDKPNIELMTKIIKEEINNSQFKNKMIKHQQQILDLGSLKEGVNDILKRLGRISKENDLTSMKYEIQGVQQFAKRQILILSNKLMSLQNSFNNNNDSKRRPLSARIKDDGKMFVSLSTKKLIPASCISCHQSSPLVEKERRTVFNSKLLYK